jgi:tetratricopeptide (TPR) repeat protein
MRSQLDAAQDIIYDAFETPRGKKRFDLARRALSVSRDCADAYVILADEAMPDDTKALVLLEEGVHAGERALGKRVFKEEAGNFWLIFETRPYMRARFMLGLILHFQGETPRAIPVFKDLLRLNPNDNQGARYELATCLLEQGNDEELENLLMEYERDGSAVWLYSRALLKFRKEGNSPAAEACLREALEENPFVLRYLLGEKDLPARHPDFMSRGERSEAVVYALDNRRAWEGTPGALAWLDSTTRSRKSGRKKVSNQASRKKPDK